MDIPSETHGAAEANSGPGAGIKISKDHSLLKVRQYQRRKGRRERET
jgi:hypothetical protein